MSQIRDTGKSGLFVGRRYIPRAAWASLAVALRCAPAAVCCAVLLWFARAESASPNPAIARGEYLTQHVAMCHECHSPRTDDGEIDETRLFAGAPVLVTSPFPSKPWALRAPSIVGLVGFTDDDAVALFTSGKRLNGTAPAPPMPPFRLTREDAMAVIVYLRSLGPSAAPPAAQSKPPAR